MTKLLSVRPREVIRRLKLTGFRIDRIRGSHYVLLHDLSKRRVVVPFHNCDLKPKTFQSILKQAGLTPQDFKNLI